MRLRSQIVVAALSIVLGCGALGTWLLARRAVSDQLLVGRAAVERQWLLRRAARRSAYQGVSQQSYFRAYLRAGDRGQMDYFATSLARAGADAVLVLDDNGQVLASAGDDAAALGEAVSPKDSAGGDRLIALHGRVADVQRIPVGEAAHPFGWVVTANRVDAGQLAADVRPFHLEAALAADNAAVSTVAGLREEAGRKHLLGDGEVKLHGARYRVSSAPFEGATLFIAVPSEALALLRGELGRQVLALVGLLALLATLGAALVTSRISTPIADLQRATARLAAGSDALDAELVRSLERRDEIGDLARAFAHTAERLGVLMLTMRRASRSLTTAVGEVDRSAAAVADGAGRQEARLADLSTGLGELTETLAGAVDQIARAESELRGIAQAHRQLDRAVSRADVALQVVERAVKHGEDLGTFGETRTQLQALRAIFAEEEAALRDAGEHEDQLRREVDGISGLHTRLGDRGAALRRALGELARVGRGHAGEAQALTRSSGALREEAAKLDDVLGRPRR